MSAVCPSCAGKGVYIPPGNKCGGCNGKGLVREKKNVTVDVPAGIDDGMRVRSVGNGEPGVNGGPAGDLYVEVHVKEHSVFERDGSDLHVQMRMLFICQS